MSPAIPRNATKAFTLLELFVVLAVIVVLLAILVPSWLPGARTRARQVVCLNNLRQVNLGFLLYSADNRNQFPWQVSTNQGGTEELIATSSAAEHFRKVAVYLKQPATFVCPFDLARQRTTNFASFNNTNLSYFMALDVITKSPLLILTGDRHLSAGRQPIRPGLYLVTNTLALGWTRELHGVSSLSGFGNLAFTDGHVEHTRSGVLPSIFQRQMLATNRLVIP